MENITNHIPVPKMRKIGRPDGLYNHLSITLEDVVQHPVLFCEKHGSLTCQCFCCNNIYWLDNPLSQSVKYFTRAITDDYTQACCALRGEKGCIKIHFAMRRDWGYPSYCFDWGYGTLNPRFLHQQEILQKRICSTLNTVSLHTKTSTPSSISITPY